jgi:hypothetical protein
MPLSDREEIFSDVKYQQNVTEKLIKPDGWIDALNHGMDIRFSLKSSLDLILSRFLVYGVVRTCAFIVWVG